MSTYQEESRCICIWDYLVPLTRFWGIFTSVVMCGVGVDVTIHHHHTGVYVILASLIVFFLEITWAVTLFLQVCVQNEQNAVFQCWDGVLWINRWKKTIIYWSFSILLILKPHRLWLSSVAGVMLVLLGILYLVLCFGSRGRGSGKETLLHNQDDYYDRYDDIFEVLDNNVRSKDNDMIGGASDSNDPDTNILEM